MLSSILRFEWRYHTRQPSFFAASLFFLLMGFALASGRFGPDSVEVNSSYLVMESMGLLSLFSLFAVAIFASNAVLRDVEHGMLEIVHTTPVGRFHYLFGRLASAALATMTVCSLAAIGMLAATFMPWIDPERLGAFDLVPYLWSLLVIMMPNVIFATVLLFTVAALTRSAVATYVGAVFTYILYLAVAALTNSPLMAASKPGAGGGTLVALLDPFALSSFFEVTRYWSIAEKNDRFVALTGTLLSNRILWLVIAAAIFAFVYTTFSFRILRKNRRKNHGTTRRAAMDVPQASPARTEPAQAMREPPRIHPRWLSSYFSATRLEWRALIWNLPFLLVLVLWMVLAGTEIHSDVFDTEYRTTLYPVTGLIVAALQQPIALFGTILLVYFAAEIFWRQQQYGMSSIINTTTMPGSAMIAAKWTALAGLMASPIASGIAVGVLLQLTKGYTNFEPLVYLSLFYFSGLPLLLLAATAMLIHAVSPGKYAGMVLVLLFVVYTRVAGSLGLGHPLWQFGSAPTVIHTDMNGFGPNTAPFGWFMLHWCLISALLLLLASLMWRGIGDTFRQRIQLLLRRSTARERVMALALLAGSIVTGGWIFYNTNVLNSYTTRAELDDWKAAYEKSYRRLAVMPQPTTTDIDLTLDFFPEQRRYHVAGTDRLANETPIPIRTIWVAVRREAENVKLSITGARLVETDRQYGMSRFDFHPPLAPGAGTEFRYDLEFARHGFEAGDQDDPILGNGTFLIGFRIFPTFGYRRGYELADARERAKRGLEPRKADDDESESFKTSREPRVNLTATLSTTIDQIAISAGKLERTWQHGDRRYFRYRTEAPISNAAAFGTARYAVAKRRAGGVSIELYYHPSHPQNVDRMLDAAVASMQTFEANFGPYPHRNLRMAEVTLQNFAGYASPGVIWFVENRAFLTDARDPDRPDVVTRRVVHEVAHQWWGHQLVPAVGPGASFLVETLAKHSESMMIERLRGRDHLDQFLEMELDRYLASRTREENLEDPLLRVDSQAYVYYAKGAVVMNAIVREIGEPALNDALRALLQKTDPKAIDLPTQLERVSSPASYALIEEWLTEIVLYNLHIDTATARRRPDGRYDLTIRVAGGKTHADGRGSELPVPLLETIEIAVYKSDGSVLHLQKHPFQQGTQSLTIVVDQLPASVVIDPHVTRIDKNRIDNALRVDVN